jgi:Mrp family chromosome partitioning ATPase
MSKDTHTSWQLALDDGSGMAWRRLALQLHHENPRGESARSVLITSANRGTQAPRAAVMLAHALAQELQQAVRLVDAYPRVADVTRLLGCAGARGFSDLTLDPDLRAQDLVLPTSNARVSLMPSGVSAQRSHSADALALAVRESSRDCDFAVLHGGPVLDDTMALSLVPFVDCVLILATENQTLLQDLDLAQRSVRVCKPKRMGLIIGTESTER